MERIPLRAYDFFGYLSAGFILVAAWDQLLGLRLLSRGHLPPVLWAVLIGAAYIAGHAVSHVSSVVLERIVVRAWLGSPTKALMATTRPKVRGFLFPGYFHSLDVSTRRRLSVIQANLGLDPQEPDALFNSAFAVLARDPGVLARLDEFRDLYGFARNTSTALLVALVGMALGGLPVSWVVGCGVVALVMFYRYLKFYRQYAYHLLLVYSAEPSGDAEP